MPLASDPYLIDSHKMLYHADRIAQWQKAQTPEEKLNVFPIYVEISPVGHCNHRCTFCAVDYIGYKVSKLDTAVLCDALSNMAHNGVKSVMFAGEGEPMLHPDIDTITCHARTVGLDVAFTTNGTALTKKFVDNALHAVKWIKVSMNGGPATYAKIHRTKEADYERVWKNLEYAALRRRNTSTQCAIGIQCVCLPENIGDLEGLTIRALDSGLDYIVIKPYSQHKSSQTKTYQEISYQDMAQQLESLKRYSNKKFSVIIRTNAMDDWDAGAHNYQTCHATPYFWAYVMASGDVYSCSAFLLNEDFNLGNISKTSFQDIWLGPKRRAHLDFMKHLDISECRLNCRMNQVNKHLDQIAHPNSHANFI